MLRWAGGGLDPFGPCELSALSALTATGKRSTFNVQRSAFADPLCIYPVIIFPWTVSNCEAPSSVSFF